MHPIEFFRTSAHIPVLAGIILSLSAAVALAQGTSVPRAGVSGAGSSSTETARVAEPRDLPAPEGVAATPDAFNFAGTYVSAWARAAASGIGLDVNNTIPYMIPPQEPFQDGINVWDAWPVRTPDGAVAEINGWVVLVGLSSEVDPAASYPFYTRSTWRFWYRRDGEWQPGGVIFSRADALGSRQWAGSTIYDPDSGEVTFYYTAVGAPDAPSFEADTPPRDLGDAHPGAGRPNTEQRMALVTASVSAGDGGVAFADFGPHELILEADGEIYVTESAYIPSEVIYGMRDPHYWRDAENGREYILFTANAAGLKPPHNGVVGISEKIDGTWTLLRPIIAAPDVSSQLERPHVITRDDGIYIFFSTHAFTFADGLSGPEGLYGFYNPDGDIHGHFRPMHGTGLVAGNPPASPVQAYSYLVLPDGSVTSYINTPWGFSNDQGETRGFVGAPAPIFQIRFEKGESAIVAAPDTLLAVQ